VTALLATALVGAAVSPSRDAGASVPRETVVARPNVVLVLLDDFSTDLTRTLRSAHWMRRHGADYAAAFVDDSLCCVSRASLFTGQYPHQTGVEANMADRAHPDDPQGGFPAFRRFGNERRSFAVGLQAAGITTGYVGKYLNEYENTGGVLPPRQPGWDDERVVFGSAYDGWGFDSTDVVGGRLRTRTWPTPAASDPPAVKDRGYAGTVVDRLARGFVRRHRDDAAPWFLEVAPYAPHARVDTVGAFPGEPVFPAAFRDRPSAAHPAGRCGRVACGALTTKGLPGYADPQADNAPRSRSGAAAPGWNPPPAGLSARVATTFRRDRARMAQSADRMLRRLLDTVDLSDTYVILTSDNGFHLGQHGLAAGKGSPYDTDVHVPLLVVGPGVVPGVRTGMVSNIDLAATVEELTGVPTPSYRSGVSFAASLRDPGVDTGDYVFLEHTWARAALGEDPDRPRWESALGLARRGRSEMDSIPSYLGVRSRDQLLVRFDLASVGGGSRHRYVYEFYDLARDGGFERVNRFARRRYRPDVAVLMGRLRAFEACAATTRGQPVSEDCRGLRYAS
jgi:arylsulfatase A-like enzyme